MPTRSFDSLYADMSNDPRIAKELEEEGRRLDAAVALMKAREASGLTQEQLAEKANVSRTTVNRIEQGRISPSFRTLSALATAMGKTLTISIA